VPPEKVDDDDDDDDNDAAAAEDDELRLCHRVRLVPPIRAESNLIDYFTVGPFSPRHRSSHRALIHRLTVHWYKQSRVCTVSSSLSVSE